MRKLLLIVLLTIATAISAFCQTPRDVMRSVASRLTGTSGISGAFKINYPANTINGTFKISGRKSNIRIAEMGEQWYDGKTMWNANKASREVTLFNPTSEELAEANPLAYLDNYSSRYNIFFSKRKDAARYLILLNPKKRSSGDVKAIEVAVNKTTMLPERLVIRMNNDSRSTVTFTNIALGRKFADSEFVFPAARYSDYETVDLR